MSKIALSGPASGTATYTISAPTGATDRTITLPDVTGTLVTSTSGSVSQAMLASGVAGNGPAFSAYASSTTSLANNTYTKIQFQTEEFDTNSNFDNATNYRFTPTVAGYYQFTCCMNVSVANFAITSFYKNGSEFKRGSQIWASSTVNLQPNSTALIYMNGSTDYVEVYGYQNSGGAVNVVTGANSTYFQAAMVRAA